MAIDINIPSQVAQTITNGVTGTAPSQDAVFDALALKENAINKGLANGYAPLNASTKIDSSYLPSYEANCILRDLNFQTCKPNPCGFFFSENSYFDRVNHQPFGKEHVLKIFRGKAEIFNFWEKARVGINKLQNEDWLL